MEQFCLLVEPISNMHVMVISFNFFGTLYVIIYEMTSPPITGHLNIFFYLVDINIFLSAFFHRIVLTLLYALLVPGTSFATADIVPL